VLSSVLVRDKAGDPKAFFVVHTAKTLPQMYELATNHRKETETWIKSIRVAVGLPCFSWGRPGARQGSLGLSVRCR
jgi:hypothetical protein